MRCWCPAAIIPMFPCRDTGLLFSGPWPRTGKSKIGSLVLSTSNRDFNKSVLAWMRHGNKRPRKAQEKVKVNGRSELDRRSGARRIRSRFQIFADGHTERKCLRGKLPLGHLRALISRGDQELHGPSGARCAQGPAAARVRLE